MIITNFTSLATDNLRKDALEIINSGIESVMIKNAMRKNIKISGETLQIQGKNWNLSKYKHIYVVGAGKAAIDMAKEIEYIFEKRITKGVVIDTRKKKLSKIKVVQGTHPLPSKVNVNATREIIEMINASDKNDLVICLISGGGSALMLSPRIALPEQIRVSKMLLQRGATIEEINTIRKHISYIKGGQLAKLARGTMITLLVSDVISNDLNVIASGPTVNDPTTIEDARRIQKKYSLPKLPFIETPKESLRNVTNILLITNVPAAEAMKEKAEKLGYKAEILTTQLKGEARDIGEKLAGMIRPGKAIIAAGETTVTVKGRGKGGRNQELVLTASKYIKNGVVISCSSDGVDFITEAGGAIADSYTRKLAEKKGLDIDKYLDKNDSYNILRKLNNIIKTGKTGTNVGDLMIAIGKK